LVFFVSKYYNLEIQWPQIFQFSKFYFGQIICNNFVGKKLPLIFLKYFSKSKYGYIELLTSEAHHSSISKYKQKSFKPGLFGAKNCLIMNTKKYLKSGVVMLTLWRKFMILEEIRLTVTVQTKSRNEQYVNVVNVSPNEDL